MMNSAPAADAGGEPMAPAAARDLIAVMRDDLSRALRCLSIPDPDWEGAARALDEVNERSCRLWRECVRESRRSDHG